MATDENGCDTYARYDQPIIETEWAEWCGQWKPADENQTREQRVQQILSLIPKDSE
jgi:hypothetical protein